MEKERTLEMNEMAVEYEILFFSPWLRLKMDKERLRNYRRK